MATLPDLPTGLAAALFAVAQRLDRAVITATEADGSMTLINNVSAHSVPHLQPALIRVAAGRLRWWLGPRRKYDDDAHAARMAGTIATALDVAAQEEVG